MYLHTIPQPSLRSVAERFNIPPSTLRHWVAHQKTHGHLSDIPQTGRPRKLDARGDRELLRAVRADPKRVLRDISNENGVSINTARRHLKEYDNSPHVCRGKPILSPSNIAGRLRWIEETRGLDFKTVMFTDESAFQVGAGARTWCVRPPGTAHLPQYIEPVLRRGATLHVWGAIYHGVKLPLYRFDLAKARTINGKKVRSETITGEVYARQVLGGPLETYVNQLTRAGHEVVVVEVGAPVHTSKYVKTVRSLSSFPSAFHPSASPDLNPIENIWAVLKYCVTRLPRRPTSLDELWQALEKLWDEMDQGIHDRAVESMYRRREDLRRAKGGTVMA